MFVQVLVYTVKCTSSLSHIYNTQNIYLLTELSLPQITTFYSSYLSNLSFQNYVRFYFINCQTFEVIRTQHESEGISPTGGDSLGEVPPLPLPGCLHLMGGQVTILLQLLVQVLRNVMYTKTELVESDQDANKP